MNLRTLLLTCALAVGSVVAARAGLIGLYSFDDSGTPLADSSGANNHLTVPAGTDAVWGAATGFNNTGAYDYSADRLIAPVNVNPAVMPQMTWGAWVRTDSLVSGTRKVLGHDNGAWDRTIGLDNRNPGTLRYTTFVGDGNINNSGPLEGTPTPANTTDWSFIAASYDQTAKRVTMYVDLDASTTTDPLVAIAEYGSFGAGNTTFAIGGLTPTGTGEAWDGAIDNVFVYNEVLTPEKMTRIRNRGLAELQGTPTDPQAEITRAVPLFGPQPFDMVPATISGSITVKNTGTSADLIIGAPVLSGTNAAAFSVISAPASLTPGTQGDIVVQLATGSVNGNFSAALTFTTSDPGLPEVRIPLDAQVFARLIGLYTFDDTALPLKDESTHLNHLTGTAGTDPVWGAATGLNGTGAYDYSADRLIAPININAAVTPKMTWGAWVRTDTTTPGLYKVLGHDDGAWDRCIGLDNRNTGAVFRYTTFMGTTTVGGPLLGTPGPVNTTDWAFIAATYDEVTATATMYVDVDASTTADALVQASGSASFGPGAATFAIGGISPAGAGEAWDGAIDQVFIYRDVLTPAKITAIRDRGLLELRNIPVGDPNIALSPFLPFGNLTALGAGPGPVTRTVRITNTGATQNLTVSSIGFSGPDAARYSFTPPLPAPIAPTEYAEVEIVFTPTAAGGSFTADLNVASNDDDMPTATLNLSATVTTDPNIELVAAAPLFGRMTFNALPSRIDRTITVRNTGVTGTLTINAPTLTGANEPNYGFSVEFVSLPPGTEGDIIVHHAPTAPGNYSASLGITSNDPDSPGFSIPLDSTIVIVPPAALAAFYSFDNSANPLQDHSGNGNHITGNAGTDPVWGAASGYGGTGAFEFTLDQLISPLDVNPAVMPQMSWGGFVRTNTLIPGLYKVLGHDNGGYDRVLGLDTRPAGLMHYSSFLGTGVSPGTSTPLNTGDWTFVAATYDDTAGITTVYVDLNAATTGDALVTESAASAFNPGFNTFAIGGLRPDVITESWDGAIDNVFVYSGILTDEQMTNIRDQGSAAIIGADNFIVTSWQVNANGTVTLTWNSKPGATYTLRYSTDLTGAVNSWADENDDIASGGDTTSYTTAASFSSQRRVFFSVERN
jgi:hypothetical protein